MQSSIKAQLGQAQPCQKSANIFASKPHGRIYEVLPTGGWSIWPKGVTPQRWCVQACGDQNHILGNAPYLVACAIARHMNRQPPDPGDMEALVWFSISYCGSL